MADGGMLPDPEPQFEPDDHEYYIPDSPEFRQRTKALWLEALRRWKHG